MLAPNSIAPTDSLIAPVTSALITLAQQIQGIGNTYHQVPDGPPEDNSVLFPFKRMEVNADATNGKLVLTLHYEIIHVFRRARLQDALAALYPYLVPWLTVLTAWSNQTLGGIAQNLDLGEMQVAYYPHANQPALGITSSVAVRVVYNVNVQP